MKTLKVLFMVAIVFVISSCNSLPEPWQSLDLPIENGEIVNKSEEKLYVDYKTISFEGIFKLYDDALTAKGFKAIKYGSSHRPKADPPYINYIYQRNSKELSLIVSRYEDLGVTAVMLDMQN